MSNLPSPVSDDMDDTVSSTPTPFSHLHRSMSHGSQWSASDSPQHHNEGTSYQQSPPARQAPAPILSRSSSSHSVRREARSRSVSTAGKGFRHEDHLDEEDEDGDSSEHADRRVGKSVAPNDDEAANDADESGSDREEDPITLKDRQSLINVEHPFGLPIWKPALYKKSRSVTRYADEALHSIPSAQAERHLLPGNIFWVVVFGWWLSLTCFAVSALLYLVPQGGKQYSTLVFGLGWYLAWPFGKYVEGEGLDEEDEDEEDEDDAISHERHWSGDSSHTVRAPDSDNQSSSTIRGGASDSPPRAQHVQTMSWNSVIIPGEHTSLLQTVSEMHSPPPSKSYGATLSTTSSESSVGAAKENPKATTLGKICFWLGMISIIAPLMLIVCLICWGLIVTIPMAKLNWALLTHIFSHPDIIRFCAAPPSVVVSEQVEPTNAGDSASSPGASRTQFSVKHPRIAAGQVAPSGSSKVLLCTYRAVGFQYYKYTVGGVNILFVNLMPVVFFVIFDGLVLLPMVEKLEEHHKHVPRFLAFIASQGLIFILSLSSVIPLSYFIGMAVASISAQSSIGMGAVINATFGSIIEIILYSMALVQNKGHLVEGSIVGSILAGVLLMPGMSMVSAAFRRKEQKFNAKSAGVTSMMLIMAIIGALTPTLFYQTYGNFQLICSGCPSAPGPGGSSMPWICDHCYYKHPDPVDDPFYQSTVKSLMYFCAVILLFSYLVGLWFSLRTHASQIWQNPQQLMHSVELPIHQRQSLYHRLVPSAGAANPNTPGSLHRKESHAHSFGRDAASISPQPPPSQPSSSRGPPSPVLPRRVSYAATPSMPPPVHFTPVMESVDQAVKNTALQPMHLPEAMTTDDFTRAVAVATVSALRHQQAHAAQSPGRARVSGAENESASGGHGGHDAPSWSRTTSASVLLACTLLYAIIAEILVDVVDVILQGSGIDEKFLGVTLFALVPNTTEFMNAMSFALNGNIALSMEIGSAYALQVCLLQIPAMVAFSAYWAPDKMGEVAKTFTLIFPRWDVIAIILSMFLMTYTYIEAKSNYHRGSILILSYLVLTAGFFFAPHDGEGGGDQADSTTIQQFSSLTGLQYAKWYLLSWFHWWL
ncbi:hypothetical protein IW262DRAFT_1375415 [Armillaria fumosa]|nr:hypothetical protein IW262DRAFT_1375415 [Armillaria fumosa]